MFKNLKFRSELKVIILLAFLCGRTSSNPLLVAPTIAAAPLVKLAVPVVVSAAAPLVKLAAPVVVSAAAAAVASPVTVPAKPVAAAAAITTLHGLAAPFLHGFTAIPTWLSQTTKNLGAISTLVQLAEHLLSDDKDPDKLNPLDAFFLDVVPRFVGQRPNNENGTKSEYKEYAMKDVSNDDAHKLTGQQLIERSGFKYSLHDAIADDGYVTQLTRLINPKADPRFLRQPPILMEHGGTIDPTAYLIASSIQHHPEKWPRTAEDGPVTSWNRSLAFVLANNGFDVWLAETRGSNENNKRRVKSRAVSTVRAGENDKKNMTIAEDLDELARINNYWGFSQDDIIAHELKSHIDSVLSLTGAKKLHLFTYSLSTPSSLAFFSIRPDYAAKVQGYVSMAPIVSGEGVNLLVKLGLQTICPLLPDQVGTLMITDMLFTQPIRDLIVAISKSRALRYSTVKAVITLLMGPSAKYQTLLDLNVMGHMLRELSFKEAKQMCQQTKANKLQKYDYGPIKNKLLYKSTKPPIYDLSNLKIKDWIIISAANDGLSTPKIIEHLKSLVNPKPIAHFVAPGMNHLDLIAGFENDKYVNLPTLNYFEKMSFKQEGSSFKEDEIIKRDDKIGKITESSSRGVRSVQPELASTMFSNAANTFTSTMTNLTGLAEPSQMMDRIHNNLNSLFGLLGTIGDLFNLNHRQADNEVNQARNGNNKTVV